MSPNRSAEDRRGAVRARIDGRIAAGLDQPSDVTELSTGGVRLRLTAPPVVGSLHFLSLDVEGLLMDMHCVVRNVLAAPDGRGYDVGVEFQGLGPDQQRVLQDFVDRRKQPT